MSELPDWAKDPETLERIFHAAVAQGDAKGVDHVLRLMACCDPHRAQYLLDCLNFALTVARPERSGT